MQVARDRHLNEQFETFPAAQSAIAPKEQSSFSCEAPVQERQLATEAGIHKACVFGIVQGSRDQRRIR